MCPGFFHLETKPGLCPQWNVSDLFCGALTDTRLHLKASPDTSGPRLLKRCLGGSQGEFGKLVSITNICIVLAFPERVPIRHLFGSAAQCHEDGHMGSTVRTAVCWRKQAEWEREAAGPRAAPSAAQLRARSVWPARPTALVSAQCSHCKPHPGEPHPRPAQVILETSLWRGACLEQQTWPWGPVPPLTCSGTSQEPCPLVP